MIKKQVEKGSSNKVKVTFALPVEASAHTVAVLGDFNDWNPAAATKLVKRSNGTLSATVTLEAGQRYRFRYYAAGEWLNDDAADAYESSEHGSENCILLT